MIGAVAVALAAGLVAAASAAAVTVTITPPAGAKVDRVTGYFRTDDPQPTIGIAADGGARLQCDLTQDEADQWGPCGPALAGCTASLCASYTPPAPFRATSSYLIAARVLDSSGDEIADNWRDFSYDATPPTVSTGGLLGSPRRPKFQFWVKDDDLWPPPVDSAECSFTRKGAAPNWRTCMQPTPSGGYVTFRSQVPLRHVAYRFLARGIDDFGRVSPVQEIDYDPVPCVFHARRPRSIASLASRGIRVRASCDSLRRAELGVWLFAENGHGITPWEAIGSSTPLSRHTIRLRRGVGRFRGRLRLPRRAARAIRHDDSVGLVIAAGGVTAAGTNLFDPISPSLATKKFTVRR